MHDIILRRTGRGITVAMGRTLSNAISYGSSRRRSGALHHRVISQQTGIRITDDDLRREADYIAWCRSGAHPAGEYYHAGWRREGSAVR